MTEAIIVERIGRLRIMQRRYPYRMVRVGGQSWRLRDRGGNGPTLLMMPGGLGNADLFYNQMLDLPPNIRCIGVDYPDGEHEETADGLKSLLDILGVRCASLLGSSLAGYWLQIFGVRHPDRVDTMMLANSFWHARELRQNPLFDRETLSLITGDALKAQWLARLEGREVDELRDAQITILREGQAGEQLRRRLLAAGTAPDAPTMPRGIFPLFILDCEDDPMLPARSRRDLVDRYPDAVHVTLAEGGHYPSITRSAAYTRFVASAVPME